MSMVRVSKKAQGISVLQVALRICCQEKQKKKKNPAKISL